jgi:beta-galactosidase
LLAAVLACGGVRADERLTLNFNPDWRFLRADAPGAEQTAFDDHTWTSVSAPHTSNDVDTFDDWSLSGHRGEQNQWSGRTWYRKTFTVPASFRNRKVFIEFEAARQVAEIYLNGKLLGVSKTGFTPFGFDLTPHLRFEGPNVLAVMCDNRFISDPEGRASGNATNKAGMGSLAELAAKINQGIPDEVDKVQANQLPWNNPHWHPAHGGIYRNVRLYVTDPVHISLPLYSFLQTAGPYVYASDISAASAGVNFEVPVQNESAASEKIDVVANVFDRDGKQVLSVSTNGEVAANGKGQFDLVASLAKPELWEPAYPYLYKVALSLRANGKTIDTAEIPLGFRAPKWDARTGFAINGHPLKLHGWGQKPTDEWPGLGAAQPDWMHFQTLALMKEAGGNFLRWGHCAAGPAGIVAADRLGIITDQPGVDGESDTRGAAWTIRAAAFRDTLIYFRNNPSILVWEGGNQKVNRSHAKELRALVDKYDPHGGRVFTFRRADETTAEVMDICLGTEGSREIARLPVVEGEYDREESPRRVWDDFSPPNFGYPEAKGQTYHLTSEQYAVNQVAEYVRKIGAENHCGGANWIFSDSTSGGRVSCEVARAGGEVDGARLPKEAYYACRAMFRDDPQVHIIGHWNYPAGTKKTVYVVANTEEVELLLNDRSLGRTKPVDRFLFAFTNVAWQAGEIKALGYAKGQRIASQSKRTAGEPIALRLTPMTGPSGLLAEGADIALIDVEAVDAKGERCPTFQKRVDFKTTGQAIWRGGYNSGRTNSINWEYLDLECGINRVAIRSTRQAGDIVVAASCEGLKSSVITLHSKPISVVNGFSQVLPVMPAPALPKSHGPEVTSVGAPVTPPANTTQTNVGRFTKSFSYSGPTTAVHVEENVRIRKAVYLDQTCCFEELPRELEGADWVQAADADKLFSATDLMEIAVELGTVVFVAHDDRLARPAWLTRQFKATKLNLEIEKQKMKLFQRRVQRQESLTLGANTDGSKGTECKMYVVFVGSASDAVTGTRTAGLQSSETEELQIPTSNLPGNSKSQAPN